jgi:hypothetical protein
MRQKNSFFRNILLSLTGLVLGWSSIAYSADAVPKPDYSRIEQVVRKHDDWFTENIDQDYTNDEREGTISLLYLSRELFESQEKAGRSAVQGLYSSECDALIVFEGEEKSIGHEAWHALMDKLRDKSFGDKYSGPTVEEIEKYSGSKFQLPEFKELREDMLIAVEYFEISDLVAKSIGAGREHERGLINFNAVNNYIEFLRKNNNVAYRFAVANNKDEIMPILRKYESDQNEFEQKRKVGQGLAEEIRDFYKNPMDMQLGQVIGTKVRLEKLVEVKQEAAKRITESSERYKQLVLGQSDKYFRLSNEIIAKQEAQKKEGIEEIRMKFEDEKLKDEMQRLSLFGKTDKRTLYTLRDIIKKRSNKSQLKNAIQNLTDEEIGARIYHSAAILYMGPITESFYPYTEQDLDFLSQFYYNGKPMFRKIVERGRLGLLMRADGYSPEEIQKKLLNAQTFEYKGRAYDFRDTDFSIKGKIPDDKE